MEESKYEKRRQVETNFNFAAVPESAEQEAEFIDDMMTFDMGIGPARRAMGKKSVPPGNAANDLASEPCIKLQSGITIRMESLNQRATYAGMLEGFPCERINKLLIDKLIQGLKKQGRGCYLVPAVNKERPEENIEGRDPWIEMPRYECIARFSSKAGAGEFGSEANLVWYQDHFAMPIDAEVLAHIRSLDWLDVATDVDLF